MVVVLDASSVTALLTDDPVPPELTRVVGRAAMSAVALPTLFEQLRAKHFDDEKILRGILRLGLDIRPFGWNEAEQSLGLSAGLQEDLPLATLATLSLAISLRCQLISADPQMQSFKQFVDLISVAPRSDSP